MSNTNLPAIAGGTALMPEPPKWVKPASELTRRLVTGVLDSGAACGYAGNDVPVRTELERLTAEMAGYEVAIASANGTVAIEVALMALLADKGAEWCEGRTKVVTSVFTWVPGTLAAIRTAVLNYLGIEVEFILIDSRGIDWTVDENAVVDALNAHGDEILAVVIPSLLDTFAQLQVMVPVARDNGSPFIHDGAQTGGAIWLGAQPDAETKSRQEGKMEGQPAVGEGGASCFRSRRVAKLARRITDCDNPTSGPLDPAPEIDVSDALPVSGNYRLSGLPAAAALGRVLELAEPDMRARSIERLQRAGALGPVDDLDLDRGENELVRIRRVRRTIGTELVAPGGLVVFRTPPIQEWWDHGPTYGFGAVLTAEAKIELGLDADHWREVFAAEGFAAPGYKYGVRRPYHAAHQHPEWARIVGGGDFPNAEVITRDGLMFHVGHLTRDETARQLEETVARTVANIGAVRRHFELAT